MSKIPTIGIDLGTTYSCVAVYQLGKVEVIANDQGNRTTPSCVAFKETERVVGEPAKGYVGNNGVNTIFDVKRLIGRRFNDDVVQTDRKHWPFEVVNRNDDPKIRVKEEGQYKEFLPQQISSMVLIKMKDVAETYLGGTVKDAVITVPAYFNNAQREATIEAGIIAGLNVKRIINEPTAAAMAFGSDKKIRDKQNILIFDLGGGTFDVSIVSISNGNFEVQAVGGNTHLGGEDFDTRMVSYFVNEIKNTYKTDISNNKRCLHRLRTECEKAKRSLSSCVEASIDIPFLFDGIDFSSKISRACFENLNADLFDQTVDAVENALRNSNLRKTEIDEIVLVGGSTRILKIQKLLENFFDNKKELNKSINPDEAVAYGAAIQAAMLDGIYQFKDMVLSDVTPLSLGTDIRGDIMSVVIERNTRIPATKTSRYQTSRTDQSRVNVDVYEGERPMIADNHFLGKFEITGILPRPRGEAKIDVTFKIDINGVLTVSAVENTAGNNNQITISKNKSQFSTEVVDSMIREAEEYKTKDSRRLKVAVIKNNLEMLCCDVKSALQNNDLKNKMSRDKKESVLNYCDEIITEMKSLKINEEEFCTSKENDINSIIHEYKLNVKKN